MPRGIKNNNPGNIKRSSTAWTGKSPAATDPIFEVFTTPTWGIRALAQTLRNYFLRLNLNTIHAIIFHYDAPIGVNAAGDPLDDSGNKVQDYVNFVAKRMKIGEYTGLYLNDDAQLLALTAAIIAYENNGYQYADAVIKDAIERVTV